jgi:FHS family Na+ dependent glucose MFS transporter 1
MPVMKMSATTTTTTTSTAWNADEGSSRAARTVAYFASFAALGLTLGAFGPTLPSLAERMGVTIGEIGSLFVARSLGFLLVSARGGRLYDRAPGHRVLAAMLLVMALSMALVPVVPRLWLLAFVIACLGAAEGLLDVGANTLLVRAHGHRVGPYMNGLHFFYGVGALAAPLVVARLLPLRNGLSLTYWTLALLIVPVVIWVARLPSPPARHANEVAGGGEIDRRTVALVALFFFLYVGAEVSFGGWIYSYVVVRRLGDAAAAAYLTSGFWGAFTLGRLVSVPLAARFSPRALVSASLASCGLSLALILSRPDSMTAFAAGAIALGLSMAAIFPSMFSLVGSRMELTGRIAGWLVVGASVGSMFLPWLAGRLFDTTGPRSMVVAVACALGLAACVFASLSRGPARPARAVPA